MGTDSTNSLLRLAKEEQVRLDNLVGKITARKEAIDQVIEILEGATFSSSVNYASVLNDIPSIDNLEDESIDPKIDYPHNKSKQERILHIIKQEGRAIRISELQDIILKIEGPIVGSKTLRSINHVLREMIAKGDLLKGMVANSKRHIFYVIPKFLNQNGKLKPKHFPKRESFGKLSEIKQRGITDCFK